MALISEGNITRQNGFVNKPVVQITDGVRFGEGMVVRYSWGGDENDLIRLANRLCSDLCADFYRGKEYREIDVRNQSVMSDAVYDLTAD